MDLAIRDARPDDAAAITEILNPIIEAGTFVDMGSVSINPNSDICTRNVAVLGIGGETATAYEPSMRLMAANLSRYPLERIVTHRFPLDQAAEAVVVSQSDMAMQVVIDPSEGVPMSIETEREK